LASHFNENPVFNHRKRLFLKTPEISDNAGYVLSTGRNKVLGSKTSHYAPENA